MTIQDPFRPETGEYAPGLAKYISMVPPDVSILDYLERQQKSFAALAKLPAEKFSFRYAPEKWSVKELLVHLIDSERIFTYRALRFARGDNRPQDGYDENAFATESEADRRTPADILEDFELVRRGTIAFFKTLPADALLRSGEANNKLVTVRAMPYMIAGHAQHHLNILAERYGCDVETPS